MSTANARQVGGNHYKGSQVQHWDFLPEELGYGSEYYIGCASGYVSRHHKKGTGEQDLQKACHFLEKVSELIAHKVIAEPRSFMTMREWAYRRETIRRVRVFAAGCGLDAWGHEATALAFMFCAFELKHYDKARSHIEKAAAKAYAPKKAVVEADDIPTVPVLAPDVALTQPAPAFVFEGTAGTLDYWQCMRCSAHISVPTGMHAGDLHRCNGTRVPRSM